MKKAYNFFAGPCVLPEEAINSTIDALKDFAGTGIPLISVTWKCRRETKELRLFPMILWKILTQSWKIG